MALFSLANGGDQASTIAPSVIQSALRATVAIATRSPLNEDANNETTSQLGSGVIISSDGIVLTNAHVIGAASTFTVRLSDGQVKHAHLLGLDRLVDVALLRIEVDQSVARPYSFLSLQLAQTPQIGEPVVALGFPLNFGLSATRGIVSGLGRAYDSVWPVDFLQHDAALNPGNSGGPLIDAQGCLIGLNTATPSETLFDIGVGLAIPAELLGELVPQIVATGRFPRGHLGIYVSAADHNIARALNAGTVGGLLIDDLDQGGRAGAHGLMQGDIITHIDERPMRRVRDLTGYLLRRRQGEALQVKVSRAGQMHAIRVSLGVAPTSLLSKPQVLAGDTIIAPGPRPGLGFEVTPNANSARIESIVPDGLGDLAGLEVGDMVLAVNGTPVTDANQAIARLEDLVAHPSHPLIVLRIGRLDMRDRHLTLRLPASQSHQTNGTPSSRAVQNLPSGPF